ncbi:hypothetical protein HK101_005962 [Irineochytrium annulatum]|nr:hypothetical protein HK101_005962 [Irineochytrium annulatum]
MTSSPDTRAAAVITGSDPSSSRSGRRGRGVPEDTSTSECVPMSDDFLTSAASTPASATTAGKKRKLDRSASIASSPTKKSKPPSFTPVKVVRTSIGAPVPRESEPKYLLAVLNVASRCRKRSGPAGPATPAEIFLQKPAKETQMTAMVATAGEWEMVCSAGDVALVGLAKDAITAWRTLLTRLKSASDDGCLEVVGEARRARRVSGWTKQEGGSIIGWIGEEESCPAVTFGDANRLEVDGDTGYADHLVVRLYVAEATFKKCITVEGRNSRRLMMHLNSILYGHLNVTEEEERELVHDFLDNTEPAAFEMLEEQKDLYQPPALRLTLLSYQRKALHFMLQREGVLPVEVDQTPYFCAKMSLKTPFMFNQLTGAVALDSCEAIRIDKINSVRGGLLADEMGLGKTIEIMALILAHPMPPDGKAGDNDPVDGLTDSKATLIITPASILSQWRSELTTHAPSLKVLSLTSATQLEDKDVLHQDWDVVIMSYDILTSEMNYTVDSGGRSRRKDRVYERRESEIVRIRWWRVCLDEAQMVESTARKATQLACMLPRRNAWGVTGTPLKTSLIELHGLCDFLALLDGGFSAADATMRDGRSFVALIRALTCRNTKKKVEAELKLPAQREGVVELDFGAVERQYYDDLWEQCMQDVKRTREPIENETKKARLSREALLSQLLRGWLLQLRQTCCHPQVGDRNKRALGGELRSIGEVLALMRTSCDSKIGSLERALISVGVKRAWMWEFMKKYDSAVVIYKALLEDVRKHVKSTDELVKAAPTSENEAVEEKEKTEEHAFGLRNTLRLWKELEHQTVFFLACCYHNLKDIPLETQYYKEADDLRADMLKGSIAEVERFQAKLKADLPMVEEESQKLGNGSLRFKGGLLGREVVRKSESLWKLAHEQWRCAKAWRLRIAELLLRSIELEIQEDPTEKAKEVREGAPGSAKKKPAKTPKKAKKSSDTEKKFHDADDSIQSSSTSNSTTTSDAASATTSVETDAAVPDKVEAYEKALDDQAELDALMDAYADTLADRRQLLTGNTGARSSKDKDGLVYAGNKFALKFQSERERHVLPIGSPHLAALLKDIKADNPTASFMEKRLTAALADEFGTELTRQNDFLETLYKELNTFRKLANARIEYFIHLQKLSDDVEAPHRPPNPEAEIEILKKEEDDSRKVLAALYGRSRYLTHLVMAEREKRKNGDSSTGPGGGVNGSGPGEADENEQERDCTICKTAFEQGFVIICGHLYCDECTRAWILKKHKCALCGLPIKRGELTKVSFRELQRAAAERERERERKGKGEERPPSERMVVGLLEKTADLKIEGSFGAKLDHILKHLLHLRTAEPGAKSLVFSQWDQVLDILAKGMGSNGIKFERLTNSSRNKKRKRASGDAGGSDEPDDALQRFLRDENCEVFMLNAKSQSSGLTLVAATNVFLVEPFFDRGIELQALGRVHRIGQGKETKVWRYVVRHTIEERIIEMGRPVLGKKSWAPIKDGGGEWVGEKEMRWCLLREEMPEEVDDSGAQQDADGGGAALLEVVEEEEEEEEEEEMEVLDDDRMGMEIEVTSTVVEEKEKIKGVEVVPIEVEEEVAANRVVRKGEGRAGTRRSRMIGGLRTY